MATIRNEKGLVAGLGTWQILFIAIGGTIGIGFATTSGRVLAISGPGGLLIAFGVVGAVAICVMEGICELIVLWPIPNAMIEFVAAFVDADLAIVVGIAYWYTNAVTFAALIIGSGDFLNYFEIFGWIELAGGILKVLLLATIFIIMMLINSGSIGSEGEIGSECIGILETPLMLVMLRDIVFNDGVRNNPEVASSHVRAVLASIPLAIFSYIGVELITVTAFEAKEDSRMQLPAKHIAYVVFIIYMISVGGFAANIEWFNQNLPQFEGQSLVNITDPTANLGHVPRNANILPELYGTTSAPIIAVAEAGVKVLPGMLIGFLVYSGVSCANTALYVASRTLYGLTRNLQYNSDSVFERFFAHLNLVSGTTRVPSWAIGLSALIFASWLPFVNLRTSFSQQELQETLTAIGSVGCVLVWASQCWAFIRYDAWLRQHRDELTDDSGMSQFYRWPRQGFSSYLSSIQPIPAYIGLVLCLVIVFFLNSISFYNGQQIELKALTVYLGPGLLLFIFIILKIKHWGSPRWVVKGDLVALKRTTDRLDQLVRGGRSRPTSPIANSNLPPHSHMRGSGNDLGQQIEPYSSGYGVSGNLNPLQHGMPTPPPSTSPPIGGLPPLARNVVPTQIQTYQPTPHSSVSYRSESPLPGEGGHESHEMNSPVGPAYEASSIQDRLYGGTASRFGRGYNLGSAYGERDGTRLEEEASPQRQEGRRFSEL